MAHVTIMEADVERQLRDTIKDASKISATMPLSGVVDAFEGLATFLQSSRSQDLRLDTFCDACSLVSVLFGSLGLAFKFAEMEYVAKMHDLMAASKRYATLYNILDIDIANRSVKTQGSHSRNLRRIRQGLDLIRALFVQFMASDDHSLKDAATTAYSQVCAPYHSWAVRTAVYAGMYTLPTRDQLLLKLCETGSQTDSTLANSQDVRSLFKRLGRLLFADQTAGNKMKRYISAAAPVIEYIDNLYLSRNIGLNW